MHRHLQFAKDGSTIECISELKEIETGHPNLLYFPETGENRHITFGWRLIDGAWHEPLPPAEEESLSRQLAEIDSELRRMYDAEQFAAWKGEDAAPVKMDKDELLKKGRELREKLDKICMG